MATPSRIRADAFQVSLAGDGAAAVAQGMSAGSADVELVGVPVQNRGRLSAGRLVLVKRAALGRQ